MTTEQRQQQREHRTVLRLSRRYWRAVRVAEKLRERLVQMVDGQAARSRVSCKEG